MEPPKQTRHKKLKVLRHQVKCVHF
ncbi:hypothetical protein LEMLEM_LOCUS7114 [Lemmus lemmus]